MAELTLAELAEITLRLERGEPRERVLAERGLSEEAWLEQQMVWLSRMAAQVERQRHALFERYLSVRESATATTTSARPLDAARAQAGPLELDAGLAPRESADASSTNGAFSPVAPPPLYAAQARPAPLPPPLHVATTSAEPARSPLFASLPLPPAAAFVAPAIAPPPPVATTTAAVPPPPVPPPPVAPPPAAVAPPHEQAMLPPPGPAPASSDSPRLALQQLALLVADLTVFPERSHATLEQSGLDPSSWQAEWDAWQHRFASDPGERSRYDPLLAYYMALIRPR